MPDAQGEALNEKLDSMIMLLKHILVLQLADRGVPHAAIGKHVHLAKATVGTMLKGVRSND